MPDRVTVTSRTSWSSRLTESFRSVVVGILLFVVAFPLLFWNEGRAVKRARSLTEGAGVVVSVSPDAVDLANEGRLVHVSGFATTDEVLEDPAFGVFEVAVKLARDVEMYQWIESESSTTEKKLGGSEEKITTYQYSKEWRDHLVDADGFESPEGHRNPAAFPYEARAVTASKVALGGFALSPSQIDGLGKSEPLPLTEIPRALSGKARIQEGGALYLGADPASPAVGDARVRFRVVRPGAVSIVARQAGSSFEPYRAEAGGTIFFLEEAVASAHVMFQSAETQNVIVTWVLRGVGFFLMLVGLSVAFRPIAVLGDVVPVIGSLFGAGIGVFSFLGALFFSFVTVAFAWVVYRPLLAILLLLLAAGSGFLLARAASQRGGTARPQPPPPLPS